MNNCTCRTFARCLYCIEKGPLHRIEEDLAPDAPWRDPSIGATDYLRLWADFNDAYPEPDPQT